MRLWLLRKDGKTKYFKADEKKPTNSWLANVILSTPRRKASVSGGPPSYLFQTLDLLLLVKRLEIVFSLYSPLSLF